jgi:hypothetical protein
VDATELQQILTRIQLEYLELPNLRLTTLQARRLWNLPADWCDAALDLLVLSGFLRRTSDGVFLRRDPSRQVVWKGRSQPDLSAESEAAAEGIIGRVKICA